MEKIAVYGSGTIGSCEATLIIGHGPLRTGPGALPQGCGPELGGPDRQRSGHRGQ